MFRAAWNLWPEKHLNLQKMDLVTPKIRILESQYRPSPQTIWKPFVPWGVYWTCKGLGQETFGGKHYEMRRVDSSLKCPQPIPFCQNILYPAWGWWTISRIFWLRYFMNHQCCFIQMFLDSDLFHVLEILRTHLTLNQLSWNTIGSCWGPWGVFSLLILSQLGHIFQHFF